MPRHGAGHWAFMNGSSIAERGTNFGASVVRTRIKRFRVMSIDTVKTLLVS